MRYSTFCIKVKIFGTISKEECCSMFDINFEIELLFQRTFFFLFFFLYFLYLHRVQCYLYTRGGNNRRYRLFNSGTLFYLPFILIFRHIEIFINFKSFTKEAYSQHSQTSNRSKLFHIRAITLWKS